MAERTYDYHTSVDKSLCETRWIRVVKGVMDSYKEENSIDVLLYYCKRVLRVIRDWGGTKVKRALDRKCVLSSSLMRATRLSHEC